MKIGRFGDPSVIFCDHGKHCAKPPNTLNESRKYYYDSQVNILMIKINNLINLKLFHVRQILFRLQASQLPAKFVPLPRCVRPARSLAIQLLIVASRQWSGSQISAPCAVLRRIAGILILSNVRAIGNSRLQAPETDGSEWVDDELNLRSAWRECDLGEGITTTQHVDSAKK